MLDPFLGTGTTMFAAMIAGRSSIGCEIDPGFETYIGSQMKNVPALSSAIVTERLQNHENFVADRNKPLKYRNEHHDTPVISRQETELRLRYVADVVRAGDQKYRTEYTDSRSDQGAIGDQTALF